jgi:hypothetical protein
MSLTYKLIPNLLSADEEDYIAVMIETEPPRLLTDVENLLELFGIAVKDRKIIPAENSGVMDSLIREGRCLFTPFVNMRFGIQGNFKGANDEFDEARHTKMAYLTTGRSFQNIM